MKRCVILICVLFALAGMPALGAPPDGTWSVNGGSGGPQALVLHASGPGLTGSLDGTAISNGKTEGNFIWFTAVRGGVSYTYKGTVSGNQLDLHETRSDGIGHRRLSCTRSN